MSLRSVSDRPDGARDGGSSARPTGPARPDDNANAESESWPERVANQIRDDLFDGIITAGTRLREVSLCERFQVGRHTVRAALRILTSSGLLVHERHRGAYVPRLTRERVDAVFTFRTVIEVGSLRLALAAGSDLRRVEQAVVALESLPEGTPWRVLTDVHRRIHHEIVAAAENDRLLASYCRCEDELQLLFATIRPDFSAHRLAVLHRHLLERLRIGGEPALRALEDDIALGGRAAVLQALDRHNQGIAEPGAARPGTRSS
jgi:DNA-binding GntR family transcriptional regulator